MKKIVAIVLSLVLALAVCATASAAMNVPVTADDTFIANGNYTLPEFSTPVIDKIEQSGDKVSVTLSGNGKDYENGYFEVLFGDESGYGGYWVGGELRGNVLTVTMPEGYPNLSMIDYFNHITDDASIYVAYNADGTVDRYEVSTTIYDEAAKQYNDYYWNYTADGVLIREYITGQYEAYYYAGSGALKEYTYYPEAYDGDMIVTCAPDGTVSGITYYGPNNADYYWDEWSGWYSMADGSPADEDLLATLPSIESLAGPELVAKVTVSKEDIEIPLTSAAVAPELPLGMEEIPVVSSSKVEDGKLTVVTSANIEDFNVNSVDNYLSTRVGYIYELDGETYYCWSDSDGSYAPETKTFTAELPEGAVLVSEPRIVINYQIDNLHYYYLVDEDGVYVSASDDLAADFDQGYQYDPDGKLEYISTYLSEEDYSLYVYYDEEGNLDSYEYSIDENSTVTYLADGTLDYVWYYDEEAEKSLFWDEANGWHTRSWNAETESTVVTPVETPEDAPNPENLEPLVVVVEVVEPAKPEAIWFPKNTLGLAAVSMKDLGISSDWHNVAPVDLTTDGTTAFTLVGADAWILGNAYVTVAEGNVTVTYDILDGHGYMKSEKMNWFLTKADLTEENLKADSNYAFGEPVSIADDLDGAETAILFIDSKITFRQPYFDAYNYSTRYYRNRENWKEYREGLIEMIK